MAVSLKVELLGRVRRAVRRPHLRLGQFEALIDATGDAFVAVDEDGVIAEWNEGARAVFGWSADQAVGRRAVELLVPPASRAEFERRLASFVAGDGGEAAGRAETTALHRSGRRMPVEVTVAPVREGGRWIFNALVQDLSERKQAEQALREAEERFRRAFSDSAIGMAIASPEGRWIAFNGALVKLTGYEPERLLGMRFSEITHPADFAGDADALEALVAGQSDVFQAERRYLHAGGRLIWVGLTVSAIRDADGRTLYLVAQMQDITERRGATERLEHQALHDPLTGLANRVLLRERATMARDRLRRTGEPFAILFVDLDHFKKVNDTLGHEPGDRLLVAVAARLLDLLRTSDTAARFGGDEFALICEGVDADGARRVGTRIIEAFERPFTVGEAEVTLTVSVGMCVVDDPAISLKRVLRNADAAMYAAKAEGRSRWALFRGGKASEAAGSESQAVPASAGPANDG
ncbi:MAG: hypothetical protein QOG09_95 [Solirubrobacterales bacterium]|jgi:diguanylate cyclase (GGDEF)-like protein/PAS domain S-box-containing protein|nr:hypothetical protein [Solirubrobacterales bacterium]